MTSPPFAVRFPLCLTISYFIFFFSFPHIPDWSIPQRTTKDPGSLRTCGSYCLHHLPHSESHPLLFEFCVVRSNPILLQLSDDGHSGGGHMSSSPFRRPGSSSSDEYEDDVYAFDERAMPRRSHSHRRRSSSVSFSSRPTIIPPNGSPYQAVSSIPIPVNNFGGGSPYHSGGSPYSGSSPYHATTGLSPYHTATGYPQQYPGNVQPMPIAGSTYDPNQAVLYQGSGSYPQQTYLQAQPGMPQSLPMVAGSSYIIQQPSHHSSSSSRHKHHKHRSGSRDSRRRHRSQSDADYGHRY